MVILTLIERGLHSIDLNKLTIGKISNNRDNLPKEKIEDYMDYIFKLLFYKIKLGEIKHKIIPRKIILNDENNMIFFINSLINGDQNIEKLNMTVDILKEYKTYFSEKGIEFVFIPIPDKETIYSKKLPNSYIQYSNYTGYMNDLTKQLEKENITVINLYEQYIIEREVVFHLDDSHWNGRGVEIAVNQTIEKLNLKPLELKINTWYKMN